MKKTKRLDRRIDGSGRSLVVSENITGMMHRVMATPLFQGWSVEARELIAVSAAAAAVVEAQSPVYLELPAAASSIALHPFYAPARPYGRAEYRESQYEVDEETGQVERSPLCFTRAEVLDFVDYQVRIPHDRRLAVTIPLAFRVGFVVGWLSGLAVVQSKEAQDGMVVLTALVLPLMQSSGHMGGFLSARKVR